VVYPARAVGQTGAAEVARAVPRQREDLARRLHHYLSSGLVGCYFKAAEWQGRIGDLMGLDLDLGKVLDEVEAMGTKDVLDQAYKMISDQNNRRWVRYDLKMIPESYDLLAFKSFLERKSSGEVDIDQLLVGTLGNAISSGSEQPDITLVSFKKACIFLRAALIVSGTPLPITEADRVLARIVLISDDRVSRIEFCGRAKDLLLNSLAAPHFDNRAVLSGANTSKGLNELMGNLDPELHEEIERIDAADRDMIIREGASCIGGYLEMTHSTRKSMGLDRAESDAELVKRYCGIQNGKNDLRQFCTTQLMSIDARRGMFRMKGESRYEKAFRDGFSDLYYVLRAVELIAAREPVAAQPEPRPDYIGQEQRQYLLSVAGMVKGLNERIRDALLRLNIPLPDEIRSAVEEAIGNVQSISDSDRAKRMVDFADMIRREHNIPPGDAIHDRPELYQRTFGIIDAAISAWSEKGKLPNPAEIRTAMEMGLIFTNFIYS
jgi:hypothetical protein